MKILQSIETGGPGGAEEVLLALCSGLRRRGHEVEAVLLKRGWLADRLESASIPCRILPLSGGIDFKFVAAFADTLRESGADLLHCHEFSMSWYGRRAAVAAGVPHVATIHGKNFVGHWKRRLAAGWSLRSRPGTALAAVSADLAGHVADRAIPRLSGIEVVHNGVELPAGIEPRPRGEGALRLVAVGNLYPVKNHALLIEAVAVLAAKGIDTRLTILGRGAEHEALQRRAQELGIAERIDLAGFRDDVSAVLSESDLFVSSSLSEGMPLSFLEAMGHALPVVASRVGGVPEIVEDGRQGLLYPANDLNAAAARIESLARDEGLRLRLAKEALRAVRENGSVDAMLDAYLEMYERTGASS